MGKFSLRFYCRSDADGDGRQLDCQSKWRTIEFNPWKSNWIDVIKMAFGVRVKNNKFNKRIHRSSFEFKWKDYLDAYTLMQLGNGGNLI